MLSPSERGLRLRVPQARPDGFYIADQRRGAPLYRRGMSEHSNPAMGYAKDLLPVNEAFGRVAKTVKGIQEVINIVDGKPDGTRLSREAAKDIAKGVGETLQETYTITPAKGNS